MTTAPWLTSPKPVAEQRPPWAPEPGVTEDITNLAPRALRTGVEMIPAGPAETSGIVPSIVRKVIEWRVGLGYGDPQELDDFDRSYAATPAAGIVDKYGLESVRENITDPILGEGQDVAAQTTPGRYVKTAIENAPSAVFNPGSVPSKIAQWGAGSVASEGADQAAEALDLPPWAQDTARIVAGGVGATAPQGLNRISNPRPIPAARQPHVDVLRSRNVPISAGQLSGDSRLMMREDVAGGVRAIEEQGDAFTRAAMREQGGFPPNTERATRPAMRVELDRMGAEFDRLESQSRVPFDQGIQDDLINATIDYTENNPHIASVVESTMNELAQNAAANGGYLSGEAFKNMRTRLNKLIGNENADPGVTGALMDMKDALDGAVQRNLPPEMQSDWRRVRAQYRNYLPIERAKATGAAQSAAEGTITPPQLRSGVRAVEGRREVASGERGMTELADAGSAVLEQQRSSGTAERQLAQRGDLSGLARLLGGGGGGVALAQLLGSSGGLLPTVAGTAGALGAAVMPAIRDAFVRSDVGQRIMSRQGPRIDTGGPIRAPGTGVVPFVTGGQVRAPTAQIMQGIQQSVEPPVPVAPMPPALSSALDMLDMPEVVEDQPAYRQLGPRAFRPVAMPPPQQAVDLPALLAQALGRA